MSGIGKPDNGLSGQWAGGFTGRDGLDGRRGDLAGKADISNFRAPFSSEERELADKAAIFAHRLGDAGRIASANDPDDTARDPDFDGARLLAQCIAPATTGLPAPAESLARMPLPPRQAEAVTAILAQVNAALRAEIAPKPGQSLRLTLDLGDAVPGVASLTLDMSADRIDLLLVRASEDLSAGLVAAAQELANRLQLRFGRQIVRIHDRADRSAQERG